MLEYRDKIIEAFKDGTFSSEHLKKSDDATHDRVLKDVNNFIHKIESMSEKINLSLFEEFFQSSSPADYAKKLINTKNPNKNKKTVAKIKDRISNLKERIEKMSETEKKISADETLKIIEEILDYNNKLQKIFLVTSKVDKGKSEPKPEENIAKRVVLRRGKVAKIKREEKNINNKLFKDYFTIYQIPIHMYKNYARQKVTEMKIKYI